MPTIADFFFATKKKFTLETRKYSFILYRSGHSYNIFFFFCSAFNVLLFFLLPFYFIISFANKHFFFVTHLYGWLQVVYRQLLTA